MTELGRLRAAPGARPAVTAAASGPASAALHTVVLVAVLAAALVAVLAAPGVARAAPGTAAGASGTATQIRLLAINEFAGHLQPPRDASDAGGAAYLATYLDQLRAAADTSLLFSTGNNVGDTPIASALFHDEPTIEFLGAQRTAASAIGNHDLDAGFAELLRLQGGGCHPVDGCRFTAQFDGASFPMVGSNLALTNGQPATLPFSVSFAGAIPVGTIAITPQDLADRVAPAGVEDVRVTDPLRTIDRTAGLLHFLGVRTIVLLLHEDLNVPDDSAAGCAKATGPARRIVDQASPAVDVIFTGGTDDAFTCTLDDPDNDPRPVLQAHPDGTGVSVADVTVDSATGEVIRDRVHTFNQAVRHDVAPDADARHLVDRAVTMASAAADRDAGTAKDALTRAPGRTGESTLGAVVADAQLAATRDAGAQAALTNPGGIRADIGVGAVSYGQVFAAQPFRNRLRTITLTGAQLTDALEQQFTGRGPDDAAVILQPSAGLTYTLDTQATDGSRVSDLRIDGAPIGPGQPVRLTVNAFLAEGGDGFPAFTTGTRATDGPVDTDALAGYIRSHSPLGAPREHRITVIGPRPATG